MGLGADVSGPTGESPTYAYARARADSAAVWSMPGGFTSGGGRDGYQVVDDEPRVSVPRGPPPPQKTTIVAPTAQPAPGVQPGNYQSA
jgi:hypothetical protein